MRASRLPPRGLSPDQVPQFVSFGWDDNGFSGLPGSGGDGGLAFARALCAARRHRDGAPVRMSFYLTSRYARDDRDDEDARFVRDAWRGLCDEGHELGNHCLSHHDGTAFDVGAWRDEIEACTSDLRALSLWEAKDAGFRTPFLRFNDHTFAAVSELGFAYDCSIEEGFQPEFDGTNFLWPYLLDHGAPAAPELTPREGLWEMPAYAVIVPPDEHCAHYGMAPGFRKRMAARQRYFDESDGKITGFDYNLWFEFGMTGPEFVATLSYTLDTRLRGNRAPLLFGGHTDYYSPKYPGCATASLEERQHAVTRFLDYALEKNDVRVVPTRDVLRFVRGA